MKNQDLLRLVDEQKSLLIAVSTGGPRIQNTNNDYKERRRIIRVELKKRNIDDPNPFADLWEWYGKWSEGELPTYQSRRNYISKMYQSLIDYLNEAPSMLGEQIFSNIDGWDKLVTNVNEVGSLLRTAKTSEQFQAIGLLCREMLISLGQMVFDSKKHVIGDDTVPSLTDAKRMLEYYVSYKLEGSSQEETRRYVKSAISLANDLQHNRKAEFMRAALCAQATISTINIIGILSGQICES